MSAQYKYYVLVDAEIVAMFTRNKLVADKYTLYKCVLIILSQLQI